MSIVSAIVSGDMTIILATGLKLSRNNPDRDRIIYYKHIFEDVSEAFVHARFKQVGSFFTS